MTDTQTTAPPPVLATRQPDTRKVQLGALRARAPIGADNMPVPEPRAAVMVASFNSSI